jgi:hypothetical protein
MSIPSATPHGSRPCPPLDGAILALRSLDREAKRSSWERAAAVVVDELRRSFGTMLRTAWTRGAVERCDLEQAMLLRCFHTALPKWDPSKSSAATYLRKWVVDAVCEERRHHACSVRLAEHHASSPAADDARDDSPRSRTRLWMKSPANQTIRRGMNVDTLDELPDPCLDDPGDHIDTDRNRVVLARRILARRESEFRSTAGRRRFRLAWNHVVEGRSLRELGASEGISHTRVRQLVDDELKALRSGRIPKSSCSSRREQAFAALLQ